MEKGVIFPIPRIFVAGVALGLAIGAVAVGLVQFSAAPSGEALGEPFRRGPGGGAPPPAITTAMVEAASVGRTIDAVGVGRAARSVTLVSEATGLAEKVAIRSGDVVKAGDLILKIEDAEQQIAVARARAQHPVAKANYERFAALYKEDSASKLEADAAFNAFKTAEAELRAAEFALSRRTIRAPFDGVVGLTSIEGGDYVRAGDVVTTIDDPSALIIEFTAPQESAASMKIGQKVDASLAGGGGRVTGHISAVDSRIDTVSRTLKVEATFDDPATDLLPGATYAVTTTNEGAPALAVPGLAVQWDRTGAYVWEIGLEGAVRRASIAVLQRRDDVAIIEGDIKSGARVVVEGADRVRPGMTFPQRDAGAQGRTGAGRGAE